MPTLFETKEDADKHNSISKKIEIIENMDSLDFLGTSCDSYIKSNTGIQSPNKRFTLILEESGNLVLKDHFRTMWQSASGHIQHTVGPYKV